MVLKKIINFSIKVTSDFAVISSTSRLLFAKTSNVVFSNLVYYFVPIDFQKHFKWSKVYIVIACPVFFFMHLFWPMRYVKLVVSEIGNYDFVRFDYFL